MFITRRMDYGIRIMLALGLRPAERLSGEALARAVGVPRGFVLKIVRSLAKAGLVTARRGVGGGVRLAGRAREISLFAILRATDAPRALNPCLLEPRACSRSKKCAAHRLLTPIQEALDRKLQKTTLAHLVREQIACERERSR